MLIIIGYILSFVMGSILGLIGAGGSILAVPILVYFLKIPPITATAYSLLTVGLTAFTGATRYYHKKQIDYIVALQFVIPSMCALYIARRFIVPFIPDPVFLDVSKDLFIMLFFASIMICSGIMMLRGMNIVNIKVENNKYSLLKMIIISLIIGTVIGIIGAGGGFLIIPTLVMLAGLDMRVAVGSSLFIIAIQALFGFVGDIQSGLAINYNIMIIFILSAISGMLFGILISNKISTNNLRKLFGYFVIIIALVIIVTEI
jgi:uncharacterized protein